MPALDGIRVVDLSRVLAGPYCAQLMADNGAQVVKVETPEGDQNRFFPPIIDGQSTNYLSVNRGKKGITLNLKAAEGQAIAHALAARADIVIQSYLPKTALRLCVDYETLSRDNPGLIYVSISGYGHRGPLRDKPGYDSMVSAYSGITSLTGEAEGRPNRMGVSAIDMSTGMMAYGAAMTALVARAANGGRGQQVHLSLLETAVSLLGFRAMDWLVAGVEGKREGAGFSTLAPYQAFLAKDGDLLVGAPHEAAWQRFARTIGREDLLADARFTTNDERIANREALDAILAEVIATDTVANWLEKLEAAGVACAPINTVAKVLAEPQVHANDMVLRVADDEGREVPTVGVPFKLSGTPARPGGAPNRLGQHTEAVLRDWLDFDAEKIATLRRDGVV